MLNFSESNRPPRRNCRTCDAEGRPRRTATDTVVVLAALGAILIISDTFCPANRGVGGVYLFVDDEKSLKPKINNLHARTYTSITAAAAAVKSTGRRPTDARARTPRMSYKRNAGRTRFGGSGAQVVAAAAIAAAAVAAAVAGSRARSGVGPAVDGRDHRVRACQLPPSARGTDRDVRKALVGEVIHTYTHTHAAGSHPRRRWTARARTPASTLLFDFRFTPVFGFQFPRKSVVSRAVRRTTGRVKRRRFLAPRHGHHEAVRFFSPPPSPPATVNDTRLLSSDDHSGFRASAINLLPGNRWPATDFI